MSKALYALCQVDLSKMIAEDSPLPRFREFLTHNAEPDHAYLTEKHKDRSGEFAEPFPASPTGVVL